MRAFTSRPSGLAAGSSARFLRPRSVRACRELCCRANLESSRPVPFEHAPHAALLPWLWMRLKMMMILYTSPCPSLPPSLPPYTGESGAAALSKSGGRATSSVVPSVDAALALRLPAQTRLRGMLEQDMREDRVRRLSRQGLRALSHARGPNGDWSESTNSDLEGLAQMLAAGERTAELTQIVTDPYFLQRRLALGSHR